MNDLQMLTMRQQLKESNDIVPINRIERICKLPSGAEVPLNDDSKGSLQRGKVQQRPQTSYKTHLQKRTFGQVKKTSKKESKQSIKLLEQRVSQKEQSPIIILSQPEPKNAKEDRQSADTGKVRKIGDELKRYLPTSQPTVTMSNTNQEDSEVLPPAIPVFPPQGAKKTPKPSS